MLIWIQIAIGGALGALGRYSLTLAIGREIHSVFPWGVFSVNVIGCFFIGLLSVWAMNSPFLTHYRPLLIIGLLGGFTTFSAFGLETIQLLEAKAWKEAMFYILGTNIAGFAAVFLGMNLSR